MLNNKELQTKDQDFQALLNSFALDKAPDFDSMIWILKKTTDSQVYSSTIDFRPILDFDTALLDTTPEELVHAIKILLIIHSQGLEPIQQFRSLFCGLCLVISFIIKSRIKVLSSKNLEEFIDYFFSYVWIDKLCPSILPPAYSAFRKFIFNFCQFNQTLIAYKQLPFVKAFNRYQLISTAKKVLLTQKFNWSYSDWKEGVSHNTLGLDIGKHYINYCSSLFEDNIVTALALRETISSAENILAEVNFGAANKDKLYCVYAILSGINTKTNYFNRAYNIDKLSALEQCLTQHFRKHTFTITKQYLPYTRYGLRLICQSLNIDFSESNMATIQSMFESNRLGYKNKSSSLRDKLGASISFTALKSSVAKLAKKGAEEVTLPSSKFYSKLGFEPSLPGTPKLVHRFLKKWVEAGRTTFVAYTGWRASEFGFSLDSIKVEENTDILDSSQHQYRYFIDWFVFKTHGQNTQIREITLPTWVIASVFAQYYGAEDQQPALFKNSDSKVRGIHSNDNIYASVISNWTMFVENYRPFIALRLRNELELTKPGTESHEVIKTQILELFTDEEEENINSDPFLKKSFCKVSKELEIVSYLLTRRTNADYKKNLAEGYQDYLMNKPTCLPQSIISLLNNLLTDFQKSIIKIADSSSALTRLSAQINQMFKKHLTIPTPHAIRHLWAEAVYRRFDGDVGWMIRSQFKHISPNMWLSYIKNKSPRALNEVKYSVLSSLTEKWLRLDGQGYSGKIHHLLTSLSKRSQIITLEKLDKAQMESIYEGIENIQSNPWGYCILRQRTRHLAKCQEFGEPNPVNASPNNCLGCANNLTNSYQLDYVILQVSTHIAILKEPDLLPQAYINQSVDFLKNVRKHIITQSPEHPALIDINKVLESAC